MKGLTPELSRAAGVGLNELLGRWPGDLQMTAGFGVATDYAKGYEMAVAQKVKAILFAPLLPAAVLIDILVGDLVTGVEMPLRDKLREHRAAWLRMWNKTPNERK